VVSEMTAAIYGKELFKFWRSPENQVPSLPELAEPYLTRMTALFSAPVPEGLPPVKTSDLSSIRKTEIYLQQEYESNPEAPKVEVVGLWMTTEMINRNIQIHVWCYKGELNIGASFNQSFYEESLWRMC